MNDLNLLRATIKAINDRLDKIDRTIASLKSNKDNDDNKYLEDKLIELDTKVSSSDIRAITNMEHVLLQRINELVLDRLTEVESKLKDIALSNKTTDDTHLDHLKIDVDDVKEDVYKDIDEKVNKHLLHVEADFADRSYVNDNIKYYIEKNIRPILSHYNNALNGLENLVNKLQDRLMRKVDVKELENITTSIKKFLESEYSEISLVDDEKLNRVLEDYQTTIISNIMTDDINSKIADIYSIISELPTKAYVNNVKAISPNEVLVYDQHTIDEMLKDYIKYYEYSKIIANMYTKNEIDSMLSGYVNHDGAVEIFNDINKTRLFMNNKYDGLSKVVNELKFQVVENANKVTTLAVDINKIQEYLENRESKLVERILTVINSKNGG